VLDARGQVLELGMRRADGPLGGTTGRQRLELGADVGDVRQIGDV
jgi:hypothetical protein